MGTGVRTGAPTTEAAVAISRAPIAPAAMNETLIEREPHARRRKCAIRGCCGAAGRLAFCLFGDKMLAPAGVRRLDAAQLARSWL